MTQTTTLTELENGIAIIHSNQLEQLRDVVEYWLRQHPLAPLENELFLVQSNGMGQWLKQSLAQNSALGIAAAISVQLPSLFIWSVYRAVLGQQIPKQQLLAKTPLTWRLFRLLPVLVSRPEFAVLATFLANDSNSRKRYQLAEQLADLFDQYQVYRSDWLYDWANGLDILQNLQGGQQPLSEQHQWQAALWRAILADLNDESLAVASRSSVHEQFMQQIDELAQHPVGIPRRIILFGLSSLPQQSLEVLAKLGKFCQIVLFILNPCQHYWADIIEDKELLKAERRRHNYKSSMTATVSDEELHLHAQPLLAAWGKQGRDYIRLLDQFDDTQAYANWHWPDSKIDLFKDYGTQGERTLLQHLQQSILDLEPPASEPILLTQPDESLVFHIAHSPQREVEILHDQLLARFNAAKQTEQPLYPRDVIVMVPDINKYAPHIRAVFGQVATDDPRFLPFSLADQQQRGHNPLLVALETLLNLPESRFAVSELLCLLEVPSLRLRFGIEEAAIPKLHQWIEDAGIRWGLDAEQRVQSVSMPDNLEANTWQFGLRRMLLGYAVGAGPAYKSIEPYDEIGGLEAQWLGGLCYLLETLANYADILKQDRNAVDWQHVLITLLEDFFTDSTEREQKTLDTLTRSLTAWSDACQLAALTADDSLPLNVVREAWLSAVDEPQLHQRFLSGRINFCTLMPMRAIPFRTVCILGMNDGDYPRSQPVQSFDLMNQRGQYRPGDRSRRQDDQYLFLEAMMSARETLYISWVGRSIRDNSERQPSVLISQLREVLAQSWRLPDNYPQLLDTITLVHPLQPFSPNYVGTNRDPRLFTYAREWYENTTFNHNKTDVVAAEEKNLTLSLESLAGFLRSPVKAFCNNTLKFAFESDAVTSEDNEPFAFAALDSYQLSQDLLSALQNQNPVDVDTFFAQQRASIAGKGKLPLGSFAEYAFASIADPANSAWQQYQDLLADWPAALAAQSIALDFKLENDIQIQLTGALNCLRQHQQDQRNGLIYLTAQNLLKKENIKFRNLLLHWVQHLAASAAGLNPQTLIVGADTVIEIPVLAKSEAQNILKNLVLAWYAGLQAPLPTACNTGIAWLEAEPENALTAAQKQYEGDEWNNGEVNYDHYLTRFYPTFASLNAEQGEFVKWIQKLYEPVFSTIVKS